MGTLYSAITELYLNNAWVDVSADVRYRSGISITRGRSDERGQVSPSKCNLTLSNRTGKYSARNPLSPYYGLLGRNTPIRVRLNNYPSYLRLYGGAPATGGTISTPDTAALDITGDIDVRIDLNPSTWRPTGYMTLINKMTFTGQQSWAFYLGPDGRIYWEWSITGSSRNTATSTVAIPANSGRLTLRVTFDVDNGASGRTTTFYTGTGGVGGSFTQLGTTLTGSPVTSIFNSTSPLTIGSLSNGTSVFTPGTGLNGRVYGAQVRNGIGGTVVANPDFTAATPGASSLTDSTSKVWTTAAQARISSDGIRFHGEVSSWPPRWDLAGKDVTAPIEASGITRRLGVADAVTSPLRAFIGSQAGILSYFPMEDNAGSTKPGNAAPRGLQAGANDVSFGTDEGLPASDGAMTFNSSASSFIASIRPATATSNVSLVFLFKLDAVPVSAMELIRMNVTGVTNLVSLTVDGAGFGINIGLGGAPLVSSSVGFGTGVVLTEWVAVHIGLFQQSPGTIGWVFYRHGINSTVVGANSGTFSGTLGRAVSVGIGANAQKQSAKFAHLAVTNASFPFVTYGFSKAKAAFDGETAQERIIRLAAENGITVAVQGDNTTGDDSIVMGPQRRGNLLTLLQDAAAADGGILYEPRDWLGLAYRTRSSMQNQARGGTTLSLSYGQLTGELAPTDDDQGIENDVTVTRSGGSSARVVQETGPLNVQEPGTDPDAVGRYATSVDLANGLDADLEYVAQHRLALGTWDEARYPSISVKGRASTVPTAQLDALLRLDVGDYFTITGPPAWLPPNTIEQIAQGFGELITPHEHNFDLNSTPGGPWVVGVWNDVDAAGVEATRWDTSASTTSGSITTGTNTSVSVATTAGQPLWTTNVAHFPLDINLLGARVRVTAISGTSSPQTFTISSSVVNGVAKSIPSGTSVRLWRPARYAF